MQTHIHPIFRDALAGFAPASRDTAPDHERTISRLQAQLRHLQSLPTIAIPTNITITKYEVRHGHGYESEVPADVDVVQGVIEELLDEHIDEIRARVDAAQRQAWSDEAAA